MKTMDAESINSRESKSKLFPYKYHWNGNSKLQAESFRPSTSLQSSIEYVVCRMCSLDYESKVNDCLINVIFVEAFFNPDFSGSELLGKVEKTIAKIVNWQYSNYNLSQHRKAIHFDQDEKPSINPLPAQV